MASLVTKVLLFRDELQIHGNLINQEKSCFPSSSLSSGPFPNPGSFRCCGMQCAVQLQELNDRLEDELTPLSLYAHYHDVTFKLNLDNF